jgi:hypothetical protein
MITMTVCFNCHGSIAIVMIMVWSSTIYSMNIIDCAIRDGHVFLKNGFVANLVNL